jgi:large subunit ribosomal protein L13
MAKHYTNENLEWHIIDASSATLGRLATQVASLLLAKHRTDSEKHVAAPVRVVVTNSDKLKVTGKKKKQKMYRRYSGYPGGLRERSMQEQLEKDSTFIIHEAVFGMLPKNRLRASRMRNLFIYPTKEHPHMPQIKEETV